jgi:hypothetical protein
MPAHSRSWGFRGGLPPGVFSSSLRDLVLSADTRGGFSPRARDFLMSAGLCRVTICTRVSEPEPERG